MKEKNLMIVITVMVISVMQHHTAIHSILKQQPKTIIHHATIQENKEDFEILPGNIICLT